MTTVANRYVLTNPDPSLPLEAWYSGLNPNRRWVPGKLPAGGAAVTSWTSDDGTVMTPVTVGSNPTEADDNGWRTATFNGVTNSLRANTGITSANMRTVVVIARPSTGDASAGGGAPVASTNDMAINQAAGSDTAQLIGTATSSALAAVRDKWHFYAWSMPDSGPGVFVIDNNDTTLNTTLRNWAQFNLGRSGSQYRQLRVVEALTSADVFTAAQLKAAYASAKAWYSALAWG